MAYNDWLAQLLAAVQPAANAQRQPLDPVRPMQMDDGSMQYMMKIRPMLAALIASFNAPGTPGYGPQGTTQAANRTQTDAVLNKDRSALTPRYGGGGASATRK